MAYPQAVATLNTLGEAALAWAEADAAYYASDPEDDVAADNLICRKLSLAEARLRVAAKAHQAAIAVPHLQGPDIDADVYTVADAEADGDQG